MNGTGKNLLSSARLAFNQDGNVADTRCFLRETQKRKHADAGSDEAKFREQQTKVFIF